MTSCWWITYASSLSKSVLSQYNRATIDANSMDTTILFSRHYQYILIWRDLCAQRLVITMLHKGNTPLNKIKELSKRILPKCKTHSMGPQSVPLYLHKSSRKLDHCTVLTVQWMTDWKRGYWGLLCVEVQYRRMKLYWYHIILFWIWPEIRIWILLSCL